MEKSQFIEYIIFELNQIQAELIIEQAMASEVDEKIEKLITNRPTGLTGIISEVVALHELSKQRSEMMQKLFYLDGKFDALKKVLEHFEKNLEN